MFMILLLVSSAEQKIFRKWEMNKTNKTAIH